MKFAKLYLKAFGPFTDLLLDFEATKGQFHLIYGPNEAGKSSLLRAISALLFGIPERTQDAFLHDPGTLRIGAALTRSDGKRIAFMRRKGRTKTLLQWNEAQPQEVSSQHLEDALFADFLGSLDEGQFHSMFGLDHERLIAGGKDILSGRGDVGQSLFEAGTGLIGLRDIRTSLEDEAGRLFSPRGSTPIINKAISEYQEARIQVKQHSVRSADWVRLSKDLDAIRRRLEEVGADLQAKRRDRDRLVRIQRNLPLIARHAQCLEELQDLAGVPKLADDARERRLTAQAALRDAEERRRSSETKCEELERELNTVVIPEGLLDHSTHVEDLYKRLQSYRKAAGDLPVVQAQRDAAKTQAAVKLRAVHPALKPEEADRLRLPKAQVARIRHLITEHSSIEATVAGLQTQQQEKQRQLEDARRELTQLPEPKDLTRLEVAIEAAATEGNLEQRLGEAAVSCDVKQRRIADQVAALWAGSVDDFERLPLPGKATLDRYEQDWAKIAEEANRIGERTSGLTRDLQGIRSEIAALEAAGEVPRPESLAKSRERRDEGWKLIRAGFIEKTADPAALAESYDPHLPLPAAYERSVTKSDRAADMLCAESTRVAQGESLRRRVAEIEQALVADAENNRANEVRKDELRQNWGKVLSALALPEMTPRELAEWVRRCEKVLADIEQLRELGREIRQFEDAVQRARKQLAAALEAADLEKAAAGESLSALLGRCRRLAREIAEQNNKRRGIKDQIAALEKELLGIKGRVTEAETKLTEWRSSWQTALEPIGLNADALPVEAEAKLEALGELFDALDAVKRLESDIRALRATASAFSTDAAGLVAKVAADLGNTEPADAVEELYRRYRDANQNSVRHRSLAERLQGERHNVEAAGGELTKVGAELNALCAEAQCGDAGQLPEIEERASRKKTLDGEVRTIEKQLVEQNGLPLEQILREAEGVDRDSLGGRVTALDQAIEEQDKARLAQVEEKTTLEREFAGIDGSARAAEASQQAQEALSRARLAVDEYVRLRVSAAMLRRAIDIYRERNQGPILKRAGEIFCVLTCGAFVRLDTDFGDADSLVLVGVRDEGERVRVDGLSTGTVDQLYLALRLAAIERYLETSEPVPLIADDILIQFDDPRSAATLKALEVLSRKTQILLFTHHKHVRDWAKQHIDSEVLVLHELSPQTSA